MSKVNLTLEQYLIENRPNIMAEYKRAITPFYYEAGVEYYPIVSGFGCSGEDSSKRFRIKHATYNQDGSCTYELVGCIDEQERYLVSSKEIHLSIKRVNDSVLPLGNVIPRNKKTVFKLVNGEYYSVTKYIGWSYDKKNRTVQIDIATPSYKYRLYCNFGNRLNLKRYYKDDTMLFGSEKTTMSISVRQFKEQVFGNPNINLDKCDLFEHIL